MKKVNTIFKIAMMILCFIMTESVIEASNHFYSKVVTQTSGTGSGTAYVCTGETWSSSTATSATQDQETNDSYVNFKYTVKATPSSGSHFSGWTISGESATISSTTSLEAVVTVKATSEDDEKPDTGTATAKFDLNKHTAQLTVAKSQAGSGTSSSATVQTKYGSGSWGSTASFVANSGDSAITFNLKATPNTGYKFLGWAESDNSTSYFSTDAETTYKLKSPATEGTTNSKTVYAVFGYSTFTVVFNKNEKTGWPVTGSQMTNQTITSKSKTALTKNQYSSKLTINYDSQGGSSVSSMQKERFTRWKVRGSSPARYYNDQFVMDTLATDGSTLELDATWAEKVSVKLPQVTKTVNGVNLVCLGWFDDATGGTKVGMPDATVNIGKTGSNTETLYAHWAECGITITATTTGAFTAGDVAIFILKKTGTPEVKYRIPVPIASSMSTVLKDVPAGEYEISVDEWSWNYTATPTTATKQTVNQPVVFNFNITSKSSEKKHSEDSDKAVFGGE